jgi:hypothetical protein
LTNTNFQSYYLTVDRCVTRDGSNVCTLCLPGVGYYRMGTAPNNLCQTTAEFPAAWGIDTGASFLASPCTDAHCLACVADNSQCTACATGSGWYLDGAACEHATLAPVIPAGKGANTLTGLVVPCQDTHCLLCKPNYLTCTGCNTGSNWYLDGTSCFSPTLSPQIPSLKGANTVSGLVVSCQDIHCLLCKSNYMICTECDTPGSWYLDGTSCKHPTLAPQIPSLKGANTVTGLVVPCQDTHCLLCKPNYLTCTGCDTPGLWYLDGTSCLSPTLAPQIPSLKGANTVSGLVVPCQDTHCLLCKSNYMICTECDTPGFWYLDGTSCKHPTLAPQIPSLKGANTVSGLVVSCQDIHCLLCKPNYLTCTGCDTPGFWYLDGTSCKHPTLAPQIPVSTGANTVSGLVVPCQDTHCLLCKPNYLTCTGCDTPGLWYLDGTSCFSPTLSPQIPSLKGANTVSGLVVPCQDTHCLLCKSNYMICTECDTPGFWYLDGTSCMHPTLAPQIPSLKGANTVTGLVVPCQDTHCLLCKPNYLTCTGCDTPGFWYLDGTSCLSPTLAPQIPSLKGANTVSGLVVPCQDTHCLLCKSNYMICTECDTPGFWYLDGTSCKHPTLAPQIPSLKGANTVTGLVVPCQDTHCLLCKPNYLTCTGCDTPGLWYLDGTSCLSPTLAPQIPSLKGANTVSGLVVPCQDTHCLLCKSNYMICTECDTPGFWYLDGTSCKHPTLAPQIPSLKGANTVSGLVVSCQDIHCLLCKPNYLTCTGCDTPGFWYLDGTSCKHPTLAPQIPVSTGANTVSGLVVPCQDTHCLLCKPNYLTCTGCDTPGLWYLDGTSCLSPTLAPQIPSLKGANTVSGLVVPCQDIHCLLCKSNYMICTECDTPGFWYLDGTSCMHPTLAPQIPSLKGANTVTGLVVPCQDTHCLLCKPNYVTCSGCDTGANWFLEAGSCFHPTFAPQIGARKGANTGTGAVVPCQDANCLLCKSDYTICTGCDVGNNWYLFGTICQSPTVSPLIQIGKGANLVTGLVVACQDVHCLLCKPNYSICTSCDTASNWYLNSNICQHATLSPVFPNFSGPDTGLGTVVTCQTANCLRCPSTYVTCTACDTATGWYLNGNVCQNAASFPVGMGPNLVNGMVVSCTDPSCGNCDTNYLICSGCNVNSQYYLNTLTSQCIHQSQIADTFGADQITGTIALCADPNCQKCQADITVCSSCKVSAGYFLFNTTCVDLNNIPPGFGIDNVNFVIKVCTAGLGCLNCKMDFTNCISCDSAKKMYLNDTLCISPNQFSPGYGVDLNANAIAICLDTNCVRCVDNYQICTECDQANGYILVNGSCAMPVMFAATKTQAS